MACFEEIFFKNPRRINVKVHCHEHLAASEAHSASCALNQAYYAREDLFGTGGLNLEKIENEKKEERYNDLFKKVSALENKLLETSKNYKLLIIVAIIISVSAIALSILI